MRTLKWVTILWSLTMFSSTCGAQEVRDLHAQAKPNVGGYLRDPYSGIMNKDKVNCCNGQDCRMILGEGDFVIKREGGYILRATGEFIPELSVAPSPDANWHICRKSDLKKTVRCLMIPPGGV